MNSTSPAQTLCDARWLCHRYDEQQDAFHFVEAPRALRRDIPFLTDEYLPNAAHPRVLSRADCRSSATHDTPVHFIFHSAYCCSTLLAAALDVPGQSVSCKEPQVLNDLFGWRLRGASGTRFAETADLALRLAARPFEPGEVAVIKPSNVLNGLAADLLTLRPQARALFLYAPLRGFLGSIARKGMWGRLWVRELFMRQLESGVVDLGFEPRDYLQQTDLQVAALGWLAQHALFARMARNQPQRIRTLDSETLVARPEETLRAASELFGLGLSERQIDTSVAHAFGKDSKTGQSFEAGRRQTDREKAEDLFGDEIGKVVTWAEAVASGNGITLDLPNTLF